MQLLAFTGFEKSRNWNIILCDPTGQGTPWYLIGQSPNLQANIRL